MLDYVGVNYGYTYLLREREGTRSECAVVSAALYAICAALRPSIR